MAEIGPKGHSMDDRVVLMQLGHRLRVARVAARLKQTEVAEALGCDGSFISLVECGHRGLSIPKFLALAAVVKADPCALLEGL